MVVQIWDLVNGELYEKEFKLFSEFVDFCDRYDIYCVSVEDGGRQITIQR